MGCGRVNDADVTPQHDGGISPLRRFCANRHDGYINAAFLDSSVRKVGLKQLWTLKWYRSSDTANRWTMAGGIREQDWPGWMRGLRDY